MFSTKQKFWRWIVIGLITVGLVRLLFVQTSTVILFTLVIGGIYYLYKRPPRWLIRLGYPGNAPGQFQVPKQAPSRHRKKENKYTKKRRSFRVIDGNKKNSERNTKTQ
ncbi:hypothetical protein [Paludifilum halophilum]|uniref:Uncharacterized protein n=1 Tax=Paludifilum halophilum TaxID=1642702 RepID=A0A235BD09_9BACL|nr:hypothetical protein [Paludifilum halophilum]OYD09847.1 hypothetical protein CHM34_02345 [Paludifilum halophilum]